jgi:DNA adenine methylase
MGGKSRIAKDISAIINDYTKGELPFVSLFCGSCAIESNVNSPYKICNDKHEYLIAMWKALQNGYELPDNITKEQYQNIKANLDRDKALSGFVGFGCSFGGKWWGGYAKDNTGTNYAAQSKRAVLKELDGIRDAYMFSDDYKNIPFHNFSVVYLDPPYTNTTGYSTDAIDYNDFWEWCRNASKSHIVLISEEQAPEDFIPIWQKSFTRTLDRNKNNQPQKIEKLFVHESQVPQKVGE